MATAEYSYMTMAGHQSSKSFHDHQKAIASFSSWPMPLVLPFINPAHLVSSTSSQVSLSTTQHPPCSYNRLLTSPIPCHSLQPRRRHFTHSTHATAAIKMPRHHHNAGHGARRRRRDSHNRNKWAERVRVAAEILGPLGPLVVAVVVHVVLPLVGVPTP